MRPLSAVPNIGAPTTAYPDGLIVDNTSGITGTALTEILYGDLIQTVHKLRRASDDTPNGLPDNETNGFQILSHLFKNGLPYWQPPTFKINFSRVKFVQYNNGVYYHRNSFNTSNPPATDTTNWAFVFGWNGTKIVFSNDDAITASINQVSADLGARCTSLEDRATNLEGRATNLEGRATALEQFNTSALPTYYWHANAEKAVDFNIAAAEGTVFFRYHPTVRALFVRIDLYLKQFNNNIQNIQLTPTQSDLPIVPIYFPIIVATPSGGASPMRLEIKGGDNAVYLNSYTGTGEANKWFYGTAMIFV